MQAGLRLCWSHLPHCWKSHVSVHIWRLSKREKKRNKLLLLVVNYCVCFLYSPSLKFFASYVFFHAILSSAIFRSQLFQQCFSGIPSQYQTVWIQIWSNILQRPAYTSRQRVIFPNQGRKSHVFCFETLNGLNERLSFFVTVKNFFLFVLTIVSNNYNPTL